MISVGDGHKCYKVRIVVQPNLDREFYVVARDIATAMQGATDAFNSLQGCKITPEMDVVEVVKTNLVIWIDRDTLG